MNKISLEQNTSNFEDLFLKYYRNTDKSASSVWKETSSQHKNAAPHDLFLKEAQGMLKQDITWIKSYKLISVTVKAIYINHMMLNSSQAKYIFSIELRNLQW